MAAGESGLQRSAAAASEKIQAIIDTAERVANEIQTEADAEARRYLDERRREADRLAEERIGQLSQLSRSLVRRIDRVQGLADELAQELEAAVSSLGEIGKAPAKPQEASGTAEAQQQTDADGDVSEEAVLRATQLAVSGSSREEIESVLAAEFELEDAGAVADDILGRAEDG
jgi:uncharacterized phage infection (PIP) family protein YhgE